MACVYSDDCACDLVERGCAMAKAERFNSDQAAALCFARHLIRRDHDDNHRYWIVHGPGGHVIGLRQ